MRHRKKGRKLSRKVGHRDKLTRNLLSQLFEHGQIKTTLAKAKTIKPQIDKVVTISKKDDKVSRRRLEKMLFSTEAVNNIFDKYREDFDKRNSGYSRIIRLHRRLGDNSQIVLVDLLVDDSKKSVIEKKKSKAKKDSEDKKSDDKEEVDKKNGSFWDRFSKKEDQAKSSTAKDQQTGSSIKKDPSQRTTSK